MSINKIPSLSDLPPKKKIAANLAVQNPTKNKRQIAILLKDLGLIDNLDTIYKWQSITDVKEAIDLYGHAKVLAPAYGIHAKELEKIQEKQQGQERLNALDQKWVIDAERIKGQTLDINLPQQINHAHIHAILSDKTAEHMKNVSKSEDKP